MDDVESGDKWAAELERTTLEREKSLLFEAWRAFSLEQTPGEADEQMSAAEEVEGGILSLVRLAGEGIDTHLRDMYAKVTCAMAIFDAPGAGLPLTAAGARSYGERLRFDAVEIDVAIKWASQWIELEWLVGPSSANPLVLFFERRDDGEPLAALLLDASAQGSRRKRLTREQLGFNPTSCPWRIRIAPAHTSR